MVELPLPSAACTRQGEEITGVIIDKSSAQISRLFNKSWLSRYPRAKEIIFDSGSEFKLHFLALCKSFGLAPKPAAAKNPQSNSALERIHQAIGGALRTPTLDMADTVAAGNIGQLLTGAA